MSIDTYFMLLILGAAAGVAWGTVECKRWIEDLIFEYRLKRNYSKLYWFLNK